MGRTRGWAAAFVLGILGGFTLDACAQAMHVASQETRGALRAEASGLVDHPFGEVQHALADVATWCEILILPFNVKQCVESADSTLGLYVSRKGSESVDDAFRLDLRFTAVPGDGHSLRRMLEARKGPLDTRNYAITLEAEPADDGHTLIRLVYSYEYGTLARVAMQAYLATTAAGKVGFTAIDDGASTRLVDGTRGVMERTTARYFLAIAAYLDTLSAPPGQQPDARFNAWFDRVERYHRQLWEMDRAQYLAMKHVEAAGHSPQ